MNKPSMARWFAKKLIKGMRNIPRFIRNLIRGYIGCYLFMEDEYGNIDWGVSIGVHVVTMYTLLISGAVTSSLELLLMASLSTLTGLGLGVFSLLKAEYKKEIEE